MKILAVSLLRLGDILMHREIVRCLRSQYPQAEMHFLINQQFESVRELIPEVQSWKMMPRVQIQDILVKQNQSSERAFQLLENLVSELNAEKYDLTLNLTHNFLSVRLMDLIQCKDKRGGAFQEGKKVPHRNRWAGYLNDSFSVEKGSRFHYIEVLAKSLGLEMPSPSAIQSRGSKTIYFQLLTSDEKKNWGLQRFQKLVRELQVRAPEFEFKGLCSPAERERVLSYFSEKDICSPSLSEASELLKEARLLVTGDTSLQHMAAQVGCQVVSLFLGSADPVKTSAWQKGSWILTSKAPCSPCRHSDSCFQKSHLCGDSISVETVADLIQSLLQRTPILAFQTSGMNLEQKQTLAHEPANLERAVWSCYLENENQSLIPSFATIARENVEVSKADLALLDQRQLQISSACDEIKAVVNQISRSVLVDQKPADHTRLKALISEFEFQFSEQRDFVQQFHWCFQLKNEFQILKAYRKAFSELSELSEIRGKILKEARGMYVNEPRAAQEHSAET